MPTLGSRIKLLREQNNLSQKDFAKKLGISNVVLSRYETNERKPDFEILEKIADFFNVSIDYLFGRTTNTLTDEIINEKEFKAFSNDPELQTWYKELPESNEEDIRRLRKMWDIIKDKK